MDSSSVSSFASTSQVRAELDYPVHHEQKLLLPLTEFSADEVSLQCCLKNVKSSKGEEHWKMLY